MCPDYDYDGDIRPMCAHVDIGADESPYWVGLNDNSTVRGAVNLKVSPNPSSGAMHLRYTIHETRNSKLEVYSSDGVLVKSQSIGKYAAGEYTVDLDLSYLPDGVYYIRLQAGEMVETVKIVLLK